MLNTTIIQDYLTLCKPKVVLLILMTALVGMLLSSNTSISYSTVLTSIMGIGLTAASAAVLNQLIEHKIDLRMQRTSHRPVAQGRIQTPHALLFSIFLTIVGLGVLSYGANGLTVLLTAITFLFYGLFYTAFLKKNTPQNIVIGGLAGAMPPLLGWCAITGEITAYPLLLVLLIFVWTPPHFWALAIYRCEDYKKANMPMLPVTHGIEFTKFSILLYSILLAIISIFPTLVGMSTYFYLLIAILLNYFFLRLAIKLYRSDSKKDILKSALDTFRFSILYLFLIFFGLLSDHYLILYLREI